MGIISYAQNFEDVLLHRVFGGQETGFYVDVGAFHPVIGSVTKAFYDKGWRGINIEPGSVFSDLAAARPGDINLCMAVFDRAGEIPYVEDEADRGTSRVVMEDGHETATRMVPCDTLQAIVDAHAHGRPVDFIKIDAEGAEAAIVHSTDWRRLRPHVLLIEATRPWSSLLANQDWEPTLLQQGYVRAYFDGINCFYIPEEETATLLRHFQVPVNVLDRAERYEDKAARAELHDQQAQLKHVIMERDTARVALDKSAAETVHLAMERDTARAALDLKAAEVAHLGMERDTARAALDARAAEVVHLTMERDATRAALQEKVAEAAQLTVERHVARAALDEKLAEADSLDAERGALRRALDGKLADLQDRQDEVSRLTAERDAVHGVLAQKNSEVAGLIEMVRGLEARLAPPPPLPPPPAPVVVAPTRLRRRVARKVAKAAYRLVRPVVRPALWRLRAFMTSDIAQQIQTLDRPVETVQPLTVQLRDDSAAAEMRRLAVEMERTLLTLALERAPEPWRPVPAEQADCAGA